MLVKFFLICTFVSLQSCSNTLVGEKLENSFDNQEQSGNNVKGENKINKIKNIKIEYLEIRNKINLSTNFNRNNFKIFLAYYNKKVRLIDNY